ncbi:MAG TPA: amidohydrolase family protein [Ignavibacteriaceae bacterium]|nr:amidohydrolase family protein [Ignavibacteriaceae bacterium]
MSLNRWLLIPNEIVTVDDQNRILKNHAIEIIDNKIAAIHDLSNYPIEKFDGEVFNYSELTLIPGFIQTHIHLCQTLFRGLADDLELLDWLQLKIFPYENAHNKDSLRASVRAGILELQSGGTTTILDMGTLSYQEVIFEELINSGMRAFAGKCMIDQNDLFPEFKSTIKDELKNTYQLAKDFHNKSNGMIKYGFAPRFILSCSDTMLKETAEMQKDFPGSIYHTHSSENKNEIAEVRKRYGQENIEHFNSIGILSDHTVLAHGIHVNDNEINTLKKNDVRISHCPSSNLKLGSGIANIPRYLKEGISVSLGADGAPCNNNLSVFTEMRLASLIQKPVHGPKIMDAQTVFRVATIEGARALHIDDETGSIEVRKKADLVLLDLNAVEMPYTDDENNVYSKIVYSASANNVHSVIIDGKWVVKDRFSNKYDSREVVSNAKSELNNLLQRL